MVKNTKKSRAQKLRHTGDVLMVFGASCLLLLIIGACLNFDPLGFGQLLRKSEGWVSSSLCMAFFLPGMFVKLTGDWIEKKDDNASPFSKISPFKLIGAFFTVTLLLPIVAFGVDLFFGIAAALIFGLVLGLSISVTKLALNVFILIGIALISYWLAKPFSFFDPFESRERRKSIIKIEDRDV